MAGELVATGSFGDQTTGGGFYAFIRPTVLKKFVDTRWFRLYVGNYEIRDDESVFGHSVLPDPVESRRVTIVF